MSKVRINDLARELEVKSKQILDALMALGLAEGKTHSSSIESGEAERVRGHLKSGSRSSGSSAANSRNEQDNRPKIDLSNISKPGDVLKAIQARKDAAEREAQYPQRPAGSQVVVRPPSPATTAAAPAAPQGTVAVKPAPPTPVRVVTVPPKPEPRKIVPQPRQAPNIIPPSAPPAISTRPPVGPVVARPPLGGASPQRPAVVVAPPSQNAGSRPSAMSIAAAQLTPATPIACANGTFPTCCCDFRCSDLCN